MELSKKYFDSLVCAERAEKTEFLECVSSTNTYLKELCKKNTLPSGYCVIADSQTNGRGRLGKSFVSKGGVGIYLSYLFNVEGVLPELISQLTARSAVAVRNAVLNATGIDCKIKWVNDLVFERKKFCGILTESVSNPQNGKIKYAVLGVGVNVNNEKNDFPEELSETATSLKLISKKSHSREKLSAEILKELDALAAVFPNNTDYYLSEYRKNCAVLGKTAVFGEPPKTGLATAVTDSFALEITEENGKITTLTFGDVGIKGFYGK